MSDEPLELPLFDSPKPQGREPLEGLLGERPPATAGSGGDRAKSEREPRTAKPSGPSDVVDVEEIELEGEDDEAVAESGAEETAGVGTRLAAGLVDLLVHAAVVAVLVAGTGLMGVAITVAQWVPLTVVVTVFSFLYHVVPLAFWGQTPGMAVVGLRARSLDGRPLSLPQATRRWLSQLLTLATAGLGVLLALGGRSLADRLSGSKTLNQ